MKNDWAKGLHQQSTKGFTLIETLVVLMMLGVLATIGMPTWLSFFENRKLNFAQDRVLQVIRQAQFIAKSHNSDQTIGFRNVNGIAYWAVYPDKANSNTANWQMIHAQVKIDGSSSTLKQSNNTYQVEFNFKGNTSSLGRLTLSSSNTNRTSKLKRCVIVSTLLGHLRTGQEATAASKPACD